VTGHLTDRLNSALARYLPEQRLFLRSDTETRFIRLRPMTQIVAIGGSALILIWTIVITAILMMDSIGSGSVREQTRREQSLYATRLNVLSMERDRRAEEREKFVADLKRIQQRAHELAG
jgi:hypothetical protein